MFTYKNTRLIEQRETNRCVYGSPIGQVLFYSVSEARIFIGNKLIQIREKFELM